MTTAAYTAKAQYAATSHRGASQEVCVLGAATDNGPASGNASTSPPVAPVAQPPVPADAHPVGVTYPDCPDESSPPGPEMTNASCPGAASRRRPVPEEPGGRGERRDEDAGAAGDGEPRLVAHGGTCRGVPHPEPAHGLDNRRERLVRGN